MITTFKIYTWRYRLFSRMYQMTSYDGVIDLNEGCFQVSDNNNNNNNNVYSD